MDDVLAGLIRFASTYHMGDFDGAAKIRKTAQGDILDAVKRLEV